MTRRWSNVVHGRRSLITIGQTTAMSRQLSSKRLKRTARVLVRGLRTVMDTLQDGIAEALGRPVSVASPKQTISTGRYRTDGWADARHLPRTLNVGQEHGFGLALLALLLVCGRASSQQTFTSKRSLSLNRFSQAISRSSIIEPTTALRRSTEGSSVILANRFSLGGSTGKHFSKQTISEIQILSTFATLQPACDRLVKIGPRPGPKSTRTTHLRSSSKSSFRRFRTPTKRQVSTKPIAERFAAWLAPERIETIDLGDFGSIYNTGRYGSPGPQSHLNVTVREAETDAQKLEELLGRSTTCAGAKTRSKSASIGCLIATI